MQLNPTLDRVVIKKYDYEKISTSKILLSSLAKDNINKIIYEVVEVGPGGKVADKNINMTVKPGDIVLVPEYIGSEINMNNDHYRIVKMNEILAIVEI